MLASMKRHAFHVVIVDVEQKDRTRFWANYGYHETDDVGKKMELAQITLHDHAVTKMARKREADDDGEHMSARLDFCQQIIVYNVIVTTYALLYVPMTVGKPIRLVLRETKILVTVAAKIVRYGCLAFCRRLRRRGKASHTDRITAALDILTISLTHSRRKPRMVLSNAVRSSQVEFLPTGSMLTIDETMSNPNEKLYQAKSPNMSNHDDSEQRDIESPDSYRHDPEFEDDLRNQLQ
ncbi:hypothetical protein RB195_017116 [Necator americanus]|uniref:N-acetyltransferase domain-containing protein n=1 Tax=Necator americanus TaxID=51031 RepID=A0ABR1C3P1_NECAM